eukprot:CAMPEP_0178444294 /NCGR_PEP_ID=MMETSP0689_2-20121128/39407_1 /TAXON_ID=160604 /ORGANISM="Amphidinium massartii, Strain CS-259" /LENGTH=62 /DNA_ID=CAMNT_0020068469 /DNA_START=52 /DNA_END=236 /DNA_ORIENTATION=-
MSGSSSRETGSEEVGISSGSTGRKKGIGSSAAVAIAVLLGWSSVVPPCAEEGRASTSETKAS